MNESSTLLNGLSLSVNVNFISYGTTQVALVILIIRVAVSFNRGFPCYLHRSLVAATLSFFLLLFVD